MQRGNPMELDFEGLETRQWNRPTDRAQIVCLVIMFTPGVMVIKMSKSRKKSATVWAKYFSTVEKSYLAFLENVMDFWFLSYHWQDINP